MKNNHKSTDGAETGFSGNALFNILNRACDNAYELYRHASAANCLPVLTGCRWNGASIVMPLAPVLDDKPDPEVVATVRSIVRSQQCDYVIMFYPVEISSEDENDDAEPEFGVIVEIQLKGRPAVKRLLRIDRAAGGKSEPLPKLPIIGRTYGVFYPHLLTEGRAA